MFKCFLHVSLTHHHTTTTPHPNTTASANIQRCDHKMQSPGAWTIVPSLAHQQSDDSGSGIDGFSLISANPEFRGTSQLSHDATSNMPLSSSNDQSSSESLPPPRPAVVDWVEEQSLHDQTSNGATGLQRARVGSVPPHAGQAKQACSITNEPSSRQEGRQHSRKVYDIPTLLKLKETQSAVPVMLRVKPEAIAGELITLQLPKH